MGDGALFWQGPAVRWNDADYQRAFHEGGLRPPTYEVVQNLKMLDIDPENAVASITLYLAGFVDETDAHIEAYQRVVQERKQAILDGIAEHQAAQKMGRDIPRGGTVAPAIFYDPRWITWMWRLAVVAMVIYLLAQAL